MLAPLIFILLAAGPDPICRAAHALEAGGEQAGWPWERGGRTLAKNAEGTVALALDQLVLAGGVACNHGLRAALERECGSRGIALFVPPPKRCTDNAAMIACAGTFRLQRGERTPLDVAADPGLRLDAA